MGEISIEHLNFEESNYREYAQSDTFSNAYGSGRTRAERHLKIPYQSEC